VRVPRFARCGQIFVTLSGFDLCGIVVVVGDGLCESVEGFERAHSLISSRGPDGTVVLSPAPSCRLIGSVLSLRGATPTLQPLTTSAGLSLCLNGQVFGGPFLPPDGANDTAVLLSKLRSLPRLAPEVVADEVLANITGPFSLVLFDTVSRAVMFARDRIGRRSLVWRATGGGAVCVASVVMDDAGCEPPTGEEEEGDGEWVVRPGERWAEVPPAGLYWFSLDHPETIHLVRYSPIPSPPLLFSTSASDRLLSLLGEAVRVRVADHQGPADTPRALTIFFSGGLDCMVLAALAHRHLPAGAPVYLINLAFGTDDFESAPDRVTGRAGVAALQALIPERAWTFVAADITQEMVLASRDRVARLIAPSTSVLDLSLGTCFWFAARHATESRIVLLGTGADEQLGGYSRHRLAFERGGAEAASASMAMDVARLWTRNLGRDDRVISDNGKDARHPYLDEAVVAFLAALPFEDKVDMTRPRGEGEKLVLREVARSLGLDQAATLPKRAIQFGSRLVKMEKAQGGKKKGWQKAAI
jgi:asparagine synthetase B (glutamine-hydrolysing)